MNMRLVSSTGLLRKHRRVELTLRHRLDAQSLVWAIWIGRDAIHLNQKTDAPYRATRRPSTSLAEKQEGLLSSTDPWSQPEIEKLARELLWEPRELQKIIDGLKDKRQAIFQGPPGTGKTYVAKRIAEWCKAHGGDLPDRAVPPILFL